MTDDLAVPQDWLKELYAELQGSDRACAVIAAVTLDESLKTILQKHLLPPQKPKEDRLLGRSGLLDSFSARTELAWRLGLVTDRLRNSLDDLRDVRNLAAHATDFSFSAPKVAVRVRRIDAALLPDANLPEGLMRELGDSLKSRFVASTLLLALALDHASSSTQRVEGATRDLLSKKLKWQPQGEA
jgi:hypothetical protein